jgi:hypothetical protein
VTAQDNANGSHQGLVKNSRLLGMGGVGRCLGGNSSARRLFRVGVRFAEPLRAACQSAATSRRPLPWTHHPHQSRFGWTDGGTTHTPSWQRPQTVVPPAGVPAEKASETSDAQERKAEELRCRNPGHGQCVCCPLGQTPALRIAPPELARMGQEWQAYCRPIEIWQTQCDQSGHQRHRCRVGSAKHAEARL